MGQGLDDLAKGVESIPSPLVSIGAPRLQELFQVIQPDLNRYPVIDPKALRRTVEQLIQSVA